MKRCISLVSLALVVGACGGQPAGNQKYEISGMFLLHDGGVARSDCQGFGGYEDINRGTQVAVTDNAGAVVGLGQLGKPKTVIKNFGGDVGRLAVGCAYPFSIGGLPKSAVYSVEVSHRGAQSYSFNRLARAGWQVSLVLGEG